MWPLAHLRRRQGGESAGVPARGLTGGELEVAREHEEVKARRLVGLVRAGAVGWGVSHGEVRRWLRTARRRPCYGGGMGVWRGLGAARRSGGAKGGVGAGGGGLEGRTRGSVGLAGVAEEGRWCSGCLERETGNVSDGIEGEG